MVKIRLARGGRVHAPIYTIVATDDRYCRDGRFLEKLGHYNPNDKKELYALKTEAIRGWVTKGAQLSDTVRTLLKKHKVQY